MSLIKEIIIRLIQFFMTVAFLVEGMVLMLPGVLLTLQYVCWIMRMCL